MNLFSRLGFAAQVAAIFISSYVVFCGQYLGFITLLTSLVTDFVSPFRRASSFNTLIKFFLFVQTLLVYIFLTQTVGHQLRSDLSSSQRQQPIGVKLYDSTYTLPNKYSLSSRVPLIWKKKQQSTDRNGIDGGGVSGNHVFSGMDSITMDALLRVFHIRQNLPPPDSFPDLIFRNHSEVRSGLQRVFTEIPASGYLTKFKNPCWYKHEHSDQSREDTDKDLSCLPYAYMLGQPKCGTSDLYERLHSHPDVSSPNVKEIRWFTRGEFTVDPLPEENPLTCGHSQQCRLGRESSIYSFTKMLAKAALEIKSRPDDSVISIDGGPHLLWWSTQQPDGSFVPEDIPAVQILRELQPHARFIVTLADPVRRMYSDYWFLNDDRSVRRRDEDTNRKSADQFHDRAVEQIHMFDDCVRRVLKTYENRIILQVGAVNGTWFRAAQM